MEFDTRTSSRSSAFGVVLFRERRDWCLVDRGPTLRPPFDELLQVCEVMADDVADLVRNRPTHRRQRPGRKAAALQVELDAHGSPVGLAGEGEHRIDPRASF